jgi:hypothetical protein
MKIIGIVGSRRRNTDEDFKVVLKKFEALFEEGDWICSGGCPDGADNFAERIAKKYGIPILIFYPNWGRYGRGAGFVRNGEIAKHSDHLIACVASDRKGGTEDTVKKFKGDEHFWSDEMLHLLLEE